MDQLWDQIHANMIKIADYVPIIKVMVSRNGAIKSLSAWDKPCLTRTKKQKEKSWANFENFPTASNLSVALQSQRNFEKCQTAAMMKFETVAASHLKSNPNAFYSYMNSKRKIKAVISGIKDGDGNTLFNAEDIANELGNFGNIQESRPTRGSFCGSFCGSLCGSFCEFRGSFCEFRGSFCGSLAETSAVHSRKFLRNL